MKLDGESVTTITADGTTDLTLFLKPGKNVMTVSCGGGKMPSQPVRPHGGRPG